MSFISVDEMVATVPLPAFSSRGEVAKVKVYGITHYAETLKVVTVGEPLDKFEPFNNLPRELKTKIWKHAAEGRFIFAIEMPKPAKTKSEDGSAVVYAEAEKSKFKFIGASIPSIFQVCKEVGELKGGMGYRSMFKLPGSSKTLYFNKYIDTLDFRTAHQRALLADRLDLSNALANPFDLRYIRHLRVPLASFFHQFSNVVKDVNAMTSLKVLHLSGRFEIHPTAPEFVLKLNFENLMGDGAVPVADIPGKPLIGDKAVSRSLKRSFNFGN
jgi:hypothetical protein